jgi:subtilase family serine protease
LTKGKRCGATALAITAAALAAVPAAQAASARKQVPAAGPQATKGAADHGAAPAAQQLDLRVYLAPRGGEDALDAAVKAVTDPSSPSYRQFLTPAQYRARFAPTKAAVAAVSDWLAGAGLKVTGVESSSRYVSARGSAAKAQKAFATQLHQYSKGADTFVAPSASVSVPQSIASKVIAVSGLSTQAHVMKPAAKFPAAFVNAKPCSTYYGQVQAKFQADFQTPLPKFNGKVLPYAPCGYQPAQFRSAYEGAGQALTGIGQTVAITDAYAAPTILQDANTYATRHGDPAFAGGQFAQRNPGSFRRQAKCDPLGWYGEETLDVEAVHAMAKDAKVLYYGSASCFDDDFLATLSRVVDDNDASIVTNSWSDVEENESIDGVAAYEQLFKQGALQGIAFMFSSGDNGDEIAHTGTRQVDYPASDPYATGIGGTSTGIGQDGTLAFQSGWGTDKFSLASNGASWTPVGFLYGAGGGFSKLFNRPAYQNGVVPANGSDGSARAVPDVAMDADPTTGMLIGETQQFPNGPAYGEYRIGGTSLASPLMAGLQAVTQQRAGRMGFLNPGLYQVAHSPQFADVSGPGPDAGNVRVDYANGLNADDGLLYSVRTFNQDSSLDGDGSVKPGWDEITGIGVPTPRYIAAHK